MRKIVFCFFCFMILTSCGSGCIFGDCDDTETYTFRIKNETGTSLLITVGLDQQEIMDNGVYECSYSRTGNSGLCQGFLEIRFLNTNRGYRCNTAVSSREGLCFVNDTEVFTPIIDDSIFTETGVRTYEFTLTLELMENAFELPN